MEKQELKTPVSMQFVSSLQQQYTSPNVKVHCHK